MSNVRVSLSKRQNGIHIMKIFEWLVNRRFSSETSPFFKYWLILYSIICHRKDIGNLLDFLMWCCQLENLDLLFSVSRCIISSRKNTQWTVVHHKSSFWHLSHCSEWIYRTYTDEERVRTGDKYIDICCIIRPNDSSEAVVIWNSRNRSQLKNLKEIMLINVIRNPRKVNHVPLFLLEIVAIICSFPNQLYRASLHELHRSLVYN